MRLTSLEVPTRAAQDLVEITGDLEATLARAGVREGLLVAYVPHTTAGITIQENADPDVRTDLLLALDNAVPARPARGTFRHAEGNSDAHVKASLVGSSVTVIVTGGRMVLGRWQGVFLCEFDGPRRRTVHVRILEDEARPPPEFTDQG